jgi:hypothetical protein
MMHKIADVKLWELFDCPSHTKLQGVNTRFLWLIKMRVMLQLCDFGGGVTYDGVSFQIT